MQTKAVVLRLWRIILICAFFKMVAMETLIMYLDTIFKYFLWTTVHYLKHISKYFKYLRHSIQNCELITGVLDRNAKIIVFGFISHK